MISEREIIEGCKKGNRIAMRTLYELYIKKLRGVVFRYTRTTAETDDIVQEAFIKIFYNINSYRYKGSFEGWIKRIAINTALNLYKKNLRSEDFTDYSEPEFHKENAVDDTIDRLSAAELLKLIDLMPEGYKVIFTLFAIDGYSHKEIGEMLGIHENSSSSQYARARKYLIKILEKYEIR